MTKVKRLDLLINALSQIKAIPIKWTHYGDGILMDEIKKMAKDKLRDNIQYEFKGNVSNTELMKQYQDKNYYVFVNVSSSEGFLYQLWKQHLLKFRASQQMQGNEGDN
ncbi:MAG: hypothetical protein ACLU3F_04620 [Blautia wexlerae]